MPEATSKQSFDDLADRYDVLVDWPRRLAREAPFFKNLFARHGVQTVADVACGTGHHAAMFHSWERSVEGSDISPAMIEHCRRLHGEPDGLCWAQRSFCEPPVSSKRFDAVVCLGNSLALAGGMEGAASAVSAMMSLCRPGGIVVVSLLNQSAIEDKACVCQNVKRCRVEGREQLIIKTLQRLGEQSAVDILEVDLDHKPVAWHSRRWTMSKLERSDLERLFQSVGGVVEGVFGSYEGDDFIPATSGDLILVCRNARADSATAHRESTK
jgi:SAM-dependent methyltransferase